MQIVLSQTQEIVNGKATGNMDYPATFHSGNYSIAWPIAIWMRNFDRFLFTKNNTGLLMTLATPLSALPKGKNLHLRSSPKRGPPSCRLVDK